METNTDTAPTQCPGAAAEATPYNARGRAMRLGNCPTCGKEYRATGAGDLIRIPAHLATRRA